MYFVLQNRYLYIYIYLGVRGGGGSRRGERFIYLLSLPPIKVIQMDKNTTKQYILRTTTTIRDLETARELAEICPFVLTIEEIYVTNGGDNNGF